MENLPTYRVLVSTPDGEWESTVYALRGDPTPVESAFTLVQGESAFVVIDHLDDIHNFAQTVADCPPRPGGLSTLSVGHDSPDGPVVATVERVLFT